MTPDPDDPQSSEHGLHAMLIVGYSDRQKAGGGPCGLCGPSVKLDINEIVFGQGRQSGHNVKFLYVAGWGRDRCS